MKTKYAFVEILFIFLLFFCFIMLPVKNLSAQGIVYVNNELQNSIAGGNSNFDQNTISLEHFMQKFQLAYTVYFSYQSAALKDLKVADYDMEAHRLKDPGILLKLILTPVGLTFEKVSNVYIIKRVHTLLPVKNSSISVFEIKGTVTDKKGALANVTVTEKGTGNATITDDAGKFNLNISYLNPTLVVSMVGYKTKEVKLTGVAEITIELEPEVGELSNVIVTALGITRTKRSLGYSVGEVKSEDLVRASNINLLKSLDGKVSGVNLTSLSSDPTSSVLVNIRGTTALPTLGDRNVALKGQPLYVIDGIPVGTQTFTQKDGVDFGNILSQLNPEDIDNVTILKGGSAGALYGAEGGNGVVMITTKSGKGGKRGLGITYNVSDVYDKPYQILQKQMLYGQGERGDSWALDGTDVWGPKLDGTTTSDYWNLKTQQWANKKMYGNGENPVNAYLQTGNTVTNNISLQGNYDKGSFRLSLSNMANQGVMPNTKTDQKSISINTEYKINSKMKITVSSSYIRTNSPNKTNTAGSNGILNELMLGFPSSLQPLSEMHNYWLTGLQGVNQNGALMQDDRPANSTIVNLDNPWWSTYEKIHNFSRDNYFGKIQLDWQLTKNFSLLVRTGMENVKEYYEYRQSWSDPNNKGQYATGNNSSLLANSDAILTFNKNFGKFTLSASGGANYSYLTNNNLEMTAGRLSAPSLFMLNNSSPGTLYPSSSGWGTGQSFSMYGMVTAGYANQLYVDITGRNDYKGILQEEKIQYFYPSVSLSWLASETFKLPQQFNLLKFRIAKADVGNGLTRKRSVDTYSFDPSDWGAAKTVRINATLVDKNIKPMHSVTSEVGVDVGMFDNRIKMDFTFFIKDQKNQIDNIPTVQGTGYAGLLTNIGDVRSKGFEIGLSVTPVKTTNFSWDISTSFTQYKATITRLSEKFAPNGYVFADYGRNEKVKIAVGEEIGNMYEANPILKVKTGKYAGAYLLDGSGGEFQVSSDERDRGKLGNFNPDFILGINTTLRYRQFALNIVGSLRYGGKYISVNQKYMESNGIAFTTLGSGKNNPYWSGGRDGTQGGHAWPATGSSKYDAINSNNDGQRSDALNDASYAKGVFLDPNYTGDPANATDKDYIVNGDDLKNTFYQIPTNSYGDCIWNFSSTRTYDATNFKFREISLAYTFPAPLISKLKLTNLTLSVIGRNLLQWNKSGRNEDPESAFQGVGSDQGILRATLPSIRSYGLKLSVAL